MPFLIDVEDVRKRNKDLLSTDDIIDSEIEEAISDAQITVFTRLNESFEEPIPEPVITDSIKLCIKLIACSILIEANYSKHEEAILIAKRYYLEAQNNLKSIVNGNRLQKEGIQPYQRAISYASSIDERSNTYLQNIRCKYT